VPEYQEKPAGAIDDRDLGRYVEVVGELRAMRLLAYDRPAEPPGYLTTSVVLLDPDPVFTHLVLERRGEREPEQTWLTAGMVCRVYETDPDPDWEMSGGHPVPDATDDALVHFLRRLRLVAEKELSGGEIPTGGGTPFLVFEEHELTEWYDGVISRVKQGWRP
jgi:hypothetical protein